MNHWGSVMMAIGCFFLVCASIKSEFIFYRLFVARSEAMWKENVHRFFQFVGVAIIALGALMATGNI